MIRNLKILMLAAMALAAFGVFSASGAQAAEFHCSVAPCTATVSTDGVSGTKTAHHVFEIENTVTHNSVAITCAGIKGDGTSATETTATLTVTVEYDTPCTFLGDPSATVKMNGCAYIFHSNGEVDVECPQGKVIEFGLPKCTGTVGAQNGLKEVKYHNIGVKPNREITVETNVTNIAVKDFDEVEGGCPEGFKHGTGPWVGHYSTGNAIVTGESTPGLVMADLWWE